MVRRFITLAACLLACSACTSEDRSDVVTEPRIVPSFSDINAGGGLDLDIKIGTPQSLTVECNKDSMGDVNTVVNQDELTISVEDNAKPTHLVVHIVVPAINSLDVAGATNTNLEGVASKTFSLTTAGSSKVLAQGEADDVQMELSGSSDVQAGDLKSKNCSLTISGSGQADVYASKSVSATISGSGSVKIHGKPAKVDKHISGSGSVETL